MMRFHFASALAPFVAILSLVSLWSGNANAAQQVTVVGLVQPVPGPTICQQGETHLLDCTAVYLKSATVNLNTYVGAVVRLTGVDIGVTCHVINVTSVVPATSTLEMCGLGAMACTVRFKICPAAPLAVQALFASSGMGFLPVNLITGTLLVAPPPFVFSAGGQGFLLCSKVDVMIPSLPGLIGVPIWVQGAVQPNGPSSAPVLTNTVCFTILPPPPSGCPTPGC